MKNRLKGKTALITGATAGIGLQIARDLAEMGVNLILTGRRDERLKSVKEELIQKNISVVTLKFDIRFKDQIVKAFETINLESVDILINNAGLALGTDPVQKAQTEDWDIMIDTNIKGLLMVTRIVSPFMIKKKSGHILNLSSIAGQEAYPGGVGYNATKFAVNGITKATKMDLHGTGVRVSMISPGAVKTEFSITRFKGDEERAESVYKGITPLIADDISEIATFILNRPEHVNIMDVVVYPIAQSAATMVYRS